jgi:uncharacterized protein (TIGR02611 family)
MRRMVTVGRIAAGFALLIIGGVLAIPGVPGPGILIILLGLALLSNHFEWARRALAWCRKKWDRVIHRSTSAA